MNAKTFHERAAALYTEEAEEWELKARRVSHYVLRSNYEAYAKDARKLAELAREYATRETQK